MEDPDGRADPDLDLGLTAVLLALAGVRHGETVGAVGTGPRLRRALLAAAGAASCGDRDCDVAVAGSPADVPAAAALLRPAGRLVAGGAADGAAGGAADGAAGGTARDAAAAAGVAVRHEVPVDGCVAWSGQLRRTASTHPAP